MRIGYARVSTEEQNLDLQRQALAAAGCEKIMEDHGLSGAVAGRPALRRALAALKPGDALVVWKLDRLGRSLPHLVEVIAGLREADIGFVHCRSRSIRPAPAGGFTFTSWRLSRSSNAS